MDDDLYGGLDGDDHDDDLGVAVTRATNEKLTKENADLKQRLANAERRIQELETLNHQLSQERNQLATNMSSLYLTAKSELQRVLFLNKQKVAEDQKNRSGQRENSSSYRQPPGGGGSGDNRSRLTSRVEKR